MDWWRTQQSIFPSIRSKPHLELWKDLRFHRPQHIVLMTKLQIVCFPQSRGFVVPIDSLSSEKLLPPPPISQFSLPLCEIKTITKIFRIVCAILKKTNQFISFFDLKVVWVGKVCLPFHIVVPWHLFINVGLCRKKWLKFFICVNKSLEFAKCFVYQNVTFNFHYL